MQETVLTYPCADLHEWHNLLRSIFVCMRNKMWQTVCSPLLWLQFLPSMYGLMFATCFCIINIMQSWFRDFCFLLRFFSFLTVAFWGASGRSPEHLTGEDVRTLRARAAKALPQGHVGEASLAPPCTLLAKTGIIPSPTCCCESGVKCAGNSAASGPQAEEGPPVHQVGVYRGSRWARVSWKPGSVCRGLDLSILPGEPSWLLTGHLSLFPLQALATCLTTLSIDKVHMYVLLLRVKHPKAAWVLFVFIIFCLFHILSILVATV